MDEIASTQYGSFFSNTKYNALVDSLHAENQAHLFEAWTDVNTHLDEKVAMLDSLLAVNDSYPGGLKQYLANSRQLLKASKSGQNPYEKMIPEQPVTVNLRSLDQDYLEYEEVGFKYLGKLALVLVAGGMGERLGYPGIKVSIPFELVTKTSYLAHYCSFIKAIQARLPQCEPPLIIMTSGETHALTMRFLEENHFFGLKESQVHIIRQALVPALSDNEARIAMDGDFSIQFKPHGHGDVHQLLHHSGLAKKMKEEGIEYFSFIQDTNAQVTNALTSALGVSVKNRFAFNTICVPRVPGEAVGAITKLKGEKTVTINVEYNQLDHLLKSTVYPDGDIADASGFSPFPGNTNILVIELNRYLEVLEASSGVIAEFVNPKYTDATKEKFKKPTRLETMMQDLPKLLRADDKVGATVYDRAWSFSADKNNPVDGAKKSAENKPAETAVTAESDYYLANRIKAGWAGAKMGEEENGSELGVRFTRGPMLHLSPEFCLTLKEAKEKIGELQCEKNTALAILGKDVVIKRLFLREGSALIVQVAAGVHLEIDDEVSNQGFNWRSLTEQTLEDQPPFIQIRGYLLEDVAVKYVELTKPGHYQLRGNEIIEKKQ